MSSEKVLSETKGKMERAMQSLRLELTKVRTGRASTAIVEGLIVDYYGTPTPLKNLATLSVPEARQIVVQPWDAQAVQAIEKAILQANLGISPIVDGKILRISVPPLTEERRQDLIKLVKKMAEDCRVSVRLIRRDANEEIKKLEKEKKIPQDEQRVLQEKVQKVTDEYSAKIDSLVVEKEKDLRHL